MNCRASADTRQSLGGRGPPRQSLGGRGAPPSNSVKFRQILAAIRAPRQTVKFRQILAASRAHTTQLWSV